MSNIINIEAFSTDNMDKETHSSECCTKSIEVRVENIPLVGIFMICRCSRKIRNAYKMLIENGFVPLGESLDLHLPDYYCSYQWRPSIGGQICYRRCNCRQPKQSANR